MRTVQELIKEGFHKVGYIGKKDWNNIDVPVQAELLEKYFGDQGEIQLSETCIQVFFLARQ